MKWLRGKKIQSHWEEIQNFKKNIVLSQNKLLLE